MTIHRAFIALVLAAVVVGVAAARDTPGGTVTGHVVVMNDGKPVVGGDPVHVDAWVYLEGPKVRRKAKPPSPPAREIRQTKEQFSPRVLVVPVGTTINFPNFDLTEHNVFSPDPWFNLGRYNHDLKGLPHTFADAAEANIFCDVHMKMSAWVKVVDSGFIAPVKDGVFQIEGVPPGSYKVHAWLPDSDEVIERVEVVDGAVTRTTELHLQQGKERPHNRFDKSHYKPYL